MRVIVPACLKNSRRCAKHSYGGTQLFNDGFEKRVRRILVKRTLLFRSRRPEESVRSCVCVIFYKLFVSENDTDDSMVTQRRLKIGFWSVTCCWRVHLAGRKFSSQTFIDLYLLPSFFRLGTVYVHVRENSRLLVRTRIKKTAVIGNREHATRAVRRQDPCVRRVSC